jgi:predicted outer membrane repeat protein
VEPHAVTENSCGGAIVLWTGSPVIRNCAFINNKAYSGGAIFCYEGANPLIENNTFEKNRAIEDDYAQGYGGAICAFVYCDPTISKNTFTENYARNGGGALAFVQDCSPVIDHNLFFSDTAYWGGAIELQDNSIGQIINNTIANNHAVVQGGAIDCWDNSIAQVWSTILWENTSPIGSEVNLVESTDVLHIRYSDLMYGQSGVEGAGSIGTWKGMIDDDPLFEGSDTCNYHLRADSSDYSPCIDEGDPDCTDPDGTVCDMGAFWCNYLYVGIPPIKNRDSGLEVDIYPNPADGIVNCRLLVPAKAGINCQSLTLKIFDLYGKELQTLMDEVKSSGEYALRTDVADLPAGVYLVRLKAGAQVETVKLVVMR